MTNSGDKQIQKSDTENGSSHARTRAYSQTGHEKVFCNDESSDNDAQFIPTGQATRSSL